MDLTNTELIEYMQEYEKRFDDFPTFQFKDYSDKKIIAIVKDCLKHGKDAYDMGYLSEDVIY